MVSFNHEVHWSTSSYDVRTRICELRISNFYSFLSHKRIILIEDLRTTMEQLPQELLKNYVFPFVGDDQFLFVASVNRSFYTIYSSLFPKKQTSFLHLHSMEQVKLCYADLIIRDKAPPSPKKRIQMQRMVYLAPFREPYIPYRKCLCKELLKHCVKMGRLDWVQYLYQEACPWDEAVCSTAAYHGQLGILQWLRAQGCPWDERTCERAASGGHLEILQWTFRNGCPLDGKTFICLYYNGRQPMVALG